MRRRRRARRRRRRRRRARGISPASRRGWYAGPGCARGGTRALTIVTGVPRSGTSLVMQMLAAGGHPDRERRRAPRRPGQPPRLLRAGGGQAPGARRLLAARDGRPRREAGPHAAAVASAGSTLRVLLVRRRLDEVLASQRVMLARRGAAPDPAEDARLLPALEEQLARLERWLEARERPRLAPDRPRRAGRRARPRLAARIDAFLGGGLDAAAMAACVDPALHRQRGASAHAARSSSAAARGGWRSARASAR